MPFSQPLHPHPCFQLLKLSGGLVPAVCHRCRVDWKRTLWLSRFKGKPSICQMMWCFLSGVSQRNAACNHRRWGVTSAVFPGDLSQCIFCVAAKAVTVPSMASTLLGKTLLVIGLDGGLSLVVWSGQELLKSCWCCSLTVSAGYWQTIQFKSL